MSEEKTDKPWLYKKGQSGNPGGRPKGYKTMKTYLQEKFGAMTDEEREVFLEGLPKDIIWKMAEGNPKQDTDITSGGKEIQPVLVKFIDGSSTNDNNTDRIQATI